MTEGTGGRRKPRPEPHTPGGDRARGRALIAAVREHDDPEALQALLTEYLGLVRRIARRHAAHGDQVDDLVQEGLVGLLKAIQRFDPAPGVPFPAYARGLVAGEIRHPLRDRSSCLRLPEPVHELRDAAAVPGGRGAGRDRPRAGARRSGRSGGCRTTGGRGGGDGGRRPARGRPPGAGRRARPLAGEGRPRRSRSPGSIAASARSATSGSSPTSRRRRSAPRAWASPRCTSRGSCGAPSRRWGGRIWTSPRPDSPSARSSDSPTSGSLATPASRRCPSRLAELGEDGRVGRRSATPRSRASRCGTRPRRRADRPRGSPAPCSSSS